MTTSPALDRVIQFRAPAGLPALGDDEDGVKKILGENLRCVTGEVERVAARGATPSAAAAGR